MPRESMYEIRVLEPLEPRILHKALIQLMYCCERSGFGNGPFRIHTRSDDEPGGRIFRITALFREE